jgi:hypothetical protein
VKASDFRDWRKRVGLTQAEAGAKLGVSRGTVQNWETEVNAIPSIVETGCRIWEEQLRRIRPDLGPVTLVYADAPMFIDPYGPRGRIAMMKQEPYPTNAAALARVKELWGREDFHNPFILEKSGQHLWNVAQLARAVKGQDENAPYWRKVTIHRGNQEAVLAEANVSAMMGAYAKAYRAKEFPKDVVILRDPRVVEGFVFYFSPMAFALSGDARDIADDVAFCDEPDHADLNQVKL